MLLRLILIYTFFLPFSMTYGQLLGTKDLNAHTPIIVYHPLEHGVQVVEIDYATPWNQYYTMIEMAQPMNVPQRAYATPPPANMFIIRDSNNNILRTYNRSPLDSTGQMLQSLIDSLLPVGVIKHVKEAFTNQNSNLARRLDFNSVFNQFDGYFIVYDSTCEGGFSPDWRGRTSGTCDQGLINHSGEIVLPIIYQSIVPIAMLCDSSTRVFSMIAVKHNGRWGLLNNDLSIVTDTQFEALEASSSNRGMFNIKTGGLWGLMDCSGNIIVAPTSKNRLRKYIQK